MNTHDMTNIFVKPNQPQFFSISSRDFQVRKLPNQLAFKGAMVYLGDNAGCFKDKYILRGYQKP